MKLEEMLTQRQISFERMPHRTAYTANRIAQMLHVPGKEMAKTVLLRSNHGYVLAVLPATHQVDLTEIGQELGEDHLEMASEEDMDSVFPDCERGAIPPFGSMYHVPTIVDETLSQDDRIVFENQNHEEAIRMSYRDFENLEHPRMGHFARRR
jgi:Ala-tRNA(Pro) deacylase